MRGGLPHSEIPGSTIARISPGLIAACYVLHRLSVPRHPPDALTSRLITGIPGATTVLQPQFRHEMPHHRRAQGQDPSSRRSSAAPVARRNVVAPDTAASHEDTSSDKLQALRPEPIRLGHITTLSLHPSINTRVAVTATLFAASPKRRWCLSAKPVFRLSAGEAPLRRPWWR